MRTTSLTTERLRQAWASEGFFPGGHWWIFPNVFLEGAKSGGISFFPTPY